MARIAAKKRQWLSEVKDAKTSAPDAAAVAAAVVASEEAASAAEVAEHLRVMEAQATERDATASQGGVCLWAEALRLQQAQRESNLKMLRAYKAHATELARAQSEVLFLPTTFATPIHLCQASVQYFFS